MTCPGPADPTAEQNLIVRARGIHKTYRMGQGHSVHALRGVDFDIPRAAFLAIMGPSGSGKSTLLNLIGSLDRPSAGSIYLDGREITTLPVSHLPDLRRHLVGFVFQGFNLIPTLDATENVALPLRYEGIRGRKARSRAADILDRMGLGERLHHRPQELSGGEQQRVAIARALVLEPPLILADEPTGEVDSVTGELIMGILRDLNRQGQTIVVVTHDPSVAAHAERIVHMRDGKITGEARDYGDNNVAGP